MTAGASSLTSRATRQIFEGPPTPVVQFRAWIDAFERLGYDVEDLLRQIDVKRGDLDDPDALIPCRVVGALFEVSQRVRPQKNLWARLAAETPLGAFLLLDYLILTSNTVGEGFEQLSRYFRLVGAPFVPEIRGDGNPLQVVYVNNGPAPACSVEYGVILNLRGFRAETDDRIRFEYVSFTHEPDDVSEIECLVDCEVRSRASWAGLAILREAWQLPLKRRDPVLHSLLERQAAAVAQVIPAPDGIALDVRRALATRLVRGGAEIEIVARDLAMSARTLQRRLAAAGLSYHALLDTVRRETAERCVADAALSLGEIAYLVGYSEPAAFHRAFKRWTGVTPQVYRRRLRERRNRDPCVETPPRPPNFLPLRRRKPAPGGSKRPRPICPERTARGERHIAREYSHALPYEL
jgi:AraC-like DNA-binding protein